MSELKAKHVVDVYDDYAEHPCEDYSQVYLKSEADKVIANRDYEIKKLKDTIGKLLKAKTEQIIDEVMQKALIYGDGFVRVEDMMKLIAELRRHKYKRCLAMARWCGIGAQFQHDIVIRFDNPFHIKRAEWLEKWRNRWLELAEKFKEE